MYEGSLVTFSYIVNTFANQTYTIPSAEADINTLSVSVRANETATASDIYNRVDTVTNLTAATRAYFLSEGEDMRFQVKFGDDSVGRALKDGEVVNLEYLVTSGKKANEVKRQQACRFASKLKPVIQPLRNQGKTYQQIANILNDMGCTTAQGKSFQPIQVSRIMEREVVGV